MSLTNSFAAVTNNRFTRKWGGTNGGTVDPYITGYFHIHFAQLPPRLGEAIQISGGPDTLATPAEAASVLQATCLSLTPPGGTVNRAEFNGLGGLRWSVPTNIEYDNTMTMRFMETSTLPVFAIMHGWVRLMRDYRTGVTHVMGNGNEGDYSKSNYTGVLYFFTTKPDGFTVEQYACFTGLFPLKDPMDLYAADLTTNDKLEVDIDFSLDYMFREPWVLDRCRSIAQVVLNDRDKIDTNYGQGEPES